MGKEREFKAAIDGLAGTYNGYVCIGKTDMIVDRDAFVGSSLADVRQFADGWCNKPEPAYVDEVLREAVNAGVIVFDSRELDAEADLAYMCVLKTDGLPDTTEASIKEFANFANEAGVKVANV